MQAVLAERKGQIHRKGEAPFAMTCDKDSLAGAVSQRAGVFCGSRVVLYIWCTVLSVALYIPGISGVHCHPGRSCTA